MARSWWWRGGVGLIALAVVLVAATVAVHTPPVRRIVLARAVATLQARAGILLTADDLSYNLLALRATLSGVKVASAAEPERPFAHADGVSVVLPWSALFGTFRIQSILIENARVFIERQADGSTNLPRGEGDGGEPGAVPIDRLAVEQMALELADRESGFTLSLPALTFEIGRESGHVALRRSGFLAVGERTTQIRRLRGGLAFDGRSARLDGVTVEADEGAVQLNGRIEILARAPSLSLRLAGEADLRRLAMWAMEEPRPIGAARFEAAVEGELASPRVTLDVTSPTLEWGPVTIKDLSGRATASGERLDIEAARAAALGGRLEMSGHVEFATRRSEGRVAWENVDVAEGVRLTGSSPGVSPSARASGSATVTATGFTIQDARLDARSNLQPGVSKRGLLPVSGDIALQVDRGHWRLEADPDVAGAMLRIDLEGRLNADHLSSSSIAGSIRVEDTPLADVIEFASRAGVTGVPPIPSGTLAGGVTLTGRLDALRLDARGTASNVTVGDAKALTVDVAAKGTLDVLEFHADIEQVPGNSLSATGRLWPRRQRIELEARGRIADARRLAANVPVDGIVDLAFTGSGPFTAVRGRGTVSATGLAYADVRVGTANAAIDLNASAAHITADVPDFNLRIAGDVNRAAPYDAVIRAEAEDVDLAKVARAARSDAVPLTGAMSFDAEAGGPLSHWRQGHGVVHLSRLDARAGDLPISLAAPATVEYRDGVSEVTSLDARIGETRLSVTGRLPLDRDRPPVSASDAIRATLTGDVAHVLSALEASGVVDLPPLSGRGPLALLARVTGSLEAPDVAADLEVGPGHVRLRDLPEVTNLQVRARLEDGRLQLGSATGEWQQARAVASGALPLRLLGEYLPPTLVEALPRSDGRATLNARVTSVTPLILAPFLEGTSLSELEGVLDASLDLTAASSSLEDVEGELRLDRLDLRFAGLPVTQRQTTRIVADRGFARVVAWDWAGEGLTLGVRGQVRLEDQQSAILANGRVDLRTLTPFLRPNGVTTAGVLEPRLSITGRLTDPRVDGDIRLSAGGLRVQDPRVIATELGAHVVLSRTTAQVTALTGTINGGSLSGTGRATFGPDAPLQAQLTTTVRNMAMNVLEGLRTEIDADLTMNVMSSEDGGPLQGEVGGTVTVRRGAYREPLTLTAGLLGALRTQPAGGSASPQTDSVLNQLGLDVRILTDEDITVDNNVGRLQLGGDLRLIGTAAAPSLSGRAELRPEGLLYLGRNVYTIESGAIDFANPSYIEPIFDIRARTRAGAEDIAVTITGTPEDPGFELSSDNPDLTQADLGALLATGRTLDQLGDADAELLGREFVLGNLSGEILGFAGRATGLDAIRLGDVEPSVVRRDPTAVASKVDPTSRLTFEKSLGPTVDLTFSQSLIESDAQTWIIDYVPRRQFELRLFSGDDDLRSYELRHDVSFGARAASGGKPSPAPRRDVRVEALTFAGDVGQNESRLRRLLRLRPGDRFDFLEWQQDRDRLEEHHEEQGFREARVDARRSGDTEVTLTYDITRGPRTAIEVSGHTLSRDALAAVERAWSNSVFDGFLVEEAADIVRNALASDGYRQAEVQVSIRDGATKTLHIDITPGDPTREIRLRVEGPDQDVNSGVDEWLRGRSRSARDALDRQALAAEVTAYLRGRGHLNASVTVGAPVFDRTAAIVPITVQAGPVFTLRQVSVRGAHVPDGVQEEIRALAPGITYDPVAIDLARQRVTAVYRRAGFSDVGVTTRAEFAGDEVVVTFDVEEGPRSMLREVLVEGNESVASDSVLRSLELPIGQPLSADAWLQARRRIFDTGLFRRVDVRAEEMPHVPGEPERGIRLRVVVEEWPSLRLRYGFQVAEERPEDDLGGRDLTPGLTVDVSRRTLFGRALSVGVAGELQRRTREARTFIDAPSMFGLPLDSSLSLGWTRRSIGGGDRFDERAFVSAEQRVPLTRDLRLWYGYQFEQSRTVAPGLPGEADTVVSIQSTRLNAAAAWDVRDDPTNPSRGALVSASAEYAPNALGADFRFTRFVGQAYDFRPWRTLVFASAARVGAVRPLGDQEVLTLERFFAGGAGTVRGVAEDSLGPSDFFGPIGGEGLLVLNQEVRFPVHRWVHGVGFVDAGNVFPRLADFSLTSLTYSVGAGIRLMTPFGILRADYGRALSPAPDQPLARFTFGFGHAF